MSTSGGSPQGVVAAAPASGGAHEYENAFQALGRAEGTHFHRLSLTWVNLNFTAKVGRGKAAVEKPIIRNMSGHVRPGTFVAIMGPSGSGKTSLLNILAGRVYKGNTTLSGQVLVNGAPRDNSFKRVSAYVMQDDALFHTLTVRETVVTAAMLRLPSSTSRARKIELADSIIQELGLVKARNTPIGNEFMKGVSGGERKRANIAIEMLSNPSLIFLDEPTSGLDSFQALNVMTTMQQLSQGGRTVISTIHQPRSSIFELFEYLILLSEGQTVYFGKAKDAVDYFTRLGYPCPQHYNPADYFMDKISPDRRDESREAESIQRIKKLTAAYRPSDEVNPALLSKFEKEGDGQNFTKYGKYASTWLTQFATLFGRAFKQASRDRLPLIIAFVQSVVMSLVVGALFSGIKLNQKGVQDRTGVIFFIVVFAAFNGMFQMITTFPKERAIVNRERAGNSYRVSAYYPAKVLSEWPLRVMPLILFATVVYFITGLQRTAEKFFIFLAVCILEFTAMNATGLLVSSIAPSPETAVALGPLVTVLFMLFGGFFINLDSIPAGARWVAYCSPIQWAFIPISLNEFKGITFTCSANEPRCFRTGHDVLANLSIIKYTISETIAYQAILIGVVHTLAYLVLMVNRPRLQPLTKTSNEVTHSTRKELVTAQPVEPQNEIAV